jgi:Shikimate dehydrogenase substrate binding domain
MPDGPSFLSILIGSFASPARENPTVAMIEAAYRHAGLDARYINCDVPPEALGDAVRGAQAMGWVGFNCSIPHKVAMAELVNALAPSAEIIGAVNCVVDREGGWVGENTDGQGFRASLRTVTDPAGKHVVVFGAAARRAPSPSNPRWRRCVRHHRQPRRRARNTARPADRGPDTRRRRRRAMGSVVSGLRRRRHRRQRHADRPVPRHPALDGVDADATVMRRTLAALLPS